MPLLLLALFTFPDDAPPLPMGGMDFRQFYAAARLLSEGRGPYDYEGVAALHRAQGYGEHAHLTSHPPTALLLYVPLAWLEYRTATYAHVVLNAVIVAACAAVWARLLRPDAPGLALFCAAGVFAWFPVPLLLCMGQTTMWVLLGFTGWAAAMRGGRPVLAGALLALTSVKPHVGLVLTLFAAGVGLRARRGRAILAFAVTLAVAAAVVTLLRPGVWSEYQANLARVGAAQWYTASLTGWLRWHYGEAAWGVTIPVLIAALVGVTALGWRAGGDVTTLPATAALVPAAAVSTAVFAFSYDYVMLVPGLVAALAVRRDRPGWWVPLAGWLLLDAYLIAGKYVPGAGEPDYWFVPWFALALSGLTAARGRGMIPWGGTDFIQYYVAARLWLAGQSPYDFPAAAAMQVALGRAEGPLETYGPPVCLLPYLPGGLLDFPDAVRVNVAVNLVLVLLSALAWVRLLFGRRPEFMFVLCCLAAVPVWFPAMLVLGMGQNTPWVLAGLTGWVLAETAGRPRLAGVALAVAAAVKPHLAAVPVAFALARAARGRRWGVPAGFVATLAAAVLLTVVLRPTVWAEYVTFLQTVEPPTKKYFGATLDGWLRLHGGPEYGVVGWPLWLAAGAAAAWAGWRTTTTDGLPAAAALVLAASLATVPHAFSYDFVLLVPGYLAAVGHALRRERWTWWLAALGWAALVALLTAGRFGRWQETVYWPVPWVALAGTAMLLAADLRRQTGATE